jgi:YggT family protein
VVIIGDLLRLYLLVLLIRAVLSWFPIRPDSGLIPVIRAMDRIIDPLLMPLRRMIPPAGMFDLSYLVLVIVVWFIAARLPGTVPLV